MSGINYSISSLPWGEIQQVFLDMDGTLLDLHFDNYFWLEYVPQQYAKKRNLPLDKAKAEFMEMCRQVEGTLDWYCLDYWTDTLGLDIPRLKKEIAHLIAEHPDVIPFLQALRSSGRKAILVTNAHHNSLHLKLRHTRIGDHLDAVYSAHSLKLPKEDPAFWKVLQQHHPYDPAHTLLIDDSLPVLNAAQQYGMVHLLGVAKPDTKQARKPAADYPLVESFQSLLQSLSNFEHQARVFHH
ncbi:GMP/IMP nucleotidase [Candidatus Venteria ishoeyi]|uniref:GMP/IMP nucleotidase YrfG n=1 Tax=Candidatus Venteria ishoeyi TaxID=1899563 RepID=A0A1H6F280_9GAMM|nr:GMP/IMP nucleotidase [Candidatus Venteria ishoeyi]MDM8547018.1 GMP/IMP nucleotidase [Candidatus Venteria ishoeyi]SEH04257.1 GMP/IMP nucleotidase YrfG [Candidatus Venteria ishoeyi]SEH06580.1 GMP/IMP nucleotidase YrfG [Candidatus Venteria ishoeyi]